ncbi:MAG: CpcT/CpeT family chromophore lyase [Steroidobacteraceae bacterium]
MAEARAPLAALLATTALGALGACADSAALRRTELAELVSWLPGSYESQEPQSGVRAPLAAVLLVIVPVYAPSIGEHVFYAQEMAAADPRRVMGQRLLSFAVSDDGRILQTDYALADPLRWRDAQRNPEVFMGLQPPDLRSPASCALVWRRDADRFSASQDRDTCPARAAANGAASILEPGARLGREELVLGGAGEDASGRVVYGSADNPIYRLRKRRQP